MMKVNPCVTGETLVLTASGPVSFEKLAKMNKDVEVYCYDANGDIILSKMVHPRITGYKQQIVNITLENGMELNVTPNHEILTSKGYVAAEDIFEDDLIIIEHYNTDMMSDEIPGWLHIWTDMEPTKKGTLLRTSEVTNNTYEVTWEEREVSCEDEYNLSMNDILYETHKSIEESTCGKDYVRVDKVEFMKDKTNVYNGTVVRLHNYFTYDNNTNTIVNQKNCGE